MTARALSSAFDRIDDFLAVQSNAPGVDAARCLHRAAGIGDEELVELARRLESISASDPPTGAVLLGLILADFAREAAAGV